MSEPLIYIAPAAPLDLVEARDALLVWLLAQREQRPFYLKADAEQRRLLAWLGIEGQATEDEPEEVGVTTLYGSPSRRHHEQLPQVPFPELEQGDTPLAELKESGLVAEAVVSTLAESSWEPPRGGTLLTVTELLLYFSLDGLKEGPVKFDRAALGRAHEFFMEELTPRELLDRTLADKQLSQKQIEELEGLALLFGEEVADLKEFRHHLEFYFTPPEPVAIRGAVIEALSGLDRWKSETLTLALRLLGPADQQAISQVVVGRSEPMLADVLALLGPDEVMHRLRQGVENSTMGRK